MTTLSKIPGVFCGFSLALCRERDEAHSELQDRHQHMSPRYVVFHGGGEAWAFRRGCVRRVSHLVVSRFESPGVGVSVQTCRGCAVEAGVSPGREA